MFKIIDIKLEKNKDDFFLIEVGFSTPNGDESFGYLGEYYSAVAVPDVEAYEKHQEDPENMEWDFIKTEKDGSGEIKFRKPSPYDLGLCKITQVLGGDHIYKEDGVWKYKQYISSNYITEGALKQLLEMKEHQEKGICRWGDYPEQVGAFRSGDPYHDFIGILEVFDRFWD